MTLEEKIYSLRQMLDDPKADDAVLTVYLGLAKDKILNRLYQFASDSEHVVTEVPDRYAAIQLNVACYLYNKRGAEGEIQHIENGIHRNYGSADVPDQMLKDIVPFARAIRW